MFGKFGLRGAVLGIALPLVHTGCSGDGPTAPSPVPSAIQGTVALGVFQLSVINFAVDRVGSLSSHVDWNDANNDIDTVLVRGRCTIDEVRREASGCNAAAAVATDDTLSKPSVLSASVQPGDHTLVIVNFGPGSDAASYRLEGFVSGATAPTTSPSISTVRRTETLAFTLPAGSTSSVIVGPVRAGNGPLEVRLDFSGDFVILACVGTQSSCKVMGGRPTSATFDIPSDFPPGPIQARIYFNHTLTQPPGNASGTVAFTYNPL